MILVKMLSLQTIEQLDYFIHTYKIVFHLLIQNKLKKKGTLIKPNATPEESPPSFHKLPTYPLDKIIDQY